jgi:hypothetical protein
LFSVWNMAVRWPPHHASHFSTCRDPCLILFPWKSPSVEADSL